MIQRTSADWNLHVGRKMLGKYCLNILLNFSLCKKGIFLYSLVILNGYLTLNKLFVRQNIYDFLSYYAVQMYGKQLLLSYKQFLC